MIEVRVKCKGDDVPHAQFEDDLEKLVNHYGLEFVASGMNLKTRIRDMVFQIKEMIRVRSGGKVATRKECAVTRTETVIWTCDTCGKAVERVGAITGELEPENDWIILYRTPSRFSTGFSKREDYCSDKCLRKALKKRQP